MCSKGGNSMKLEIITDENCEEKIVIYQHNENPLTEKIKQLVEETEEIIGYKEKEILKINPYDIFCVTVMENKVCAVLKDETYQLKERLYTLEEKLPQVFVKINQSCIANIEKIERFDASISGTLKLTFKNGWTDYVSRRQLKSIKERLGI